VPGFTPGETLPATAEAVIQAYTEAILEYTDGAAFVLLGHSSGGMLGHAVTAQLEKHGTPPDALVLVDTYSHDTEVIVGIQRELVGGMLEREGSYVPMNDLRLIAMGAYLRLFSVWRPTQTTTPTLLVRATEPMSNRSRNVDWRATWTLPHTLLHAPGNHFTLMEEHAAATARIIHDWLSTRQ
jgi:thioesterase domain-containing protein